MSNQHYSFPFNDLPKAGEFRLPIFQAAVREANEDHQTPTKMAYYIAATAYCAAAQTLFDIEKPKGGTAGLGIYTVIGAKSGERKTTLDNEFFGAFIDIDNELAAKKAEFDNTHEQEMKLWMLKERAQSVKYQTAFKNGDDLEQIIGDIAEHERNRPAKVQKMQMVFKDTTIQALKNGMRHFPCVTLISSDSSKLLNETILPHDADFCEIWSAEPIKVNRITTESFVVMNPRLTKCLMIQGDRLQTIMKVKGKQGIDSGYFSRILYSNVGSTQGQRSTPIAPASRICRNAFKCNVRMILLEYIDAVINTRYARNKLKFTPEAAYVWIVYHDYVEYEMRRGGRYYNATDHASKLADNVARLAGGFHVGERFVGDVGTDCVLAAIALCDEASKDYLKDIVPKDQDELDAMELYAWLKNKLCPTNGRTRVTKFVDMRVINNMMKCCPYRMRGKTVHRPLGILESKGLVRINHEPTGRGTYVATIELLTPAAV